jgi:hypothetical protein
MHWYQLLLNGGVYAVELSTAEVERILRENGVG